MLHRAAKRHFKRIRTGGPPPVPDADNRRISGGAPPDNDAMIARDGIGRFASGASGNPARRFQPGQSGNPNGRPKGAYRAGTRAAALLLDAEAERLAHKAIEMAMAGDAVAVRFCLGRLLGVRRGQPVELDLTAVATPGDLAGAIGAITAAVADGRITPDEALSLSYRRCSTASRAFSPPCRRPNRRSIRRRHRLPGIGSSTRSTGSPPRRRCVSRRRRCASRRRCATSEGAAEARRRGCYWFSGWEPQPG